MQLLKFCSLFIALLINKPIIRFSNQQQFDFPAQHQVRSGCIVPELFRKEPETTEIFCHLGGQSRIPAVTAAPAPLAPLRPKRPQTSISCDKFLPLLSSFNSIPRVHQQPSPSFSAGVSRFPRCTSPLSHFNHFHYGFHQG